MTEQDELKCPVRRGLTIFEGKWNIRILYELIARSPQRFGELRKAVPGISNTMLASTLRLLEEKGLVERTQYNEIPPHVEYSLTESGKELVPIFDAIGEWSVKYLENKEED